MKRKIRKKTIRWLALILTLHLLIGTLYATQTPLWQAPDEPAHYNYIAHIARGDGLPVLAMGDFDLAYNSELVSKKFPPDMSVRPMRYESYQPPLYYLIMAPVYSLVAGFGPNNLDEKHIDEQNSATYGTALIAIRLAGVLLAAISLVLLYACAVAIFPQRPELALGATAFAAALPMHAAMTAAANNDTLAELLILASVLVLLRWMRQTVAEGSARVSRGPTPCLREGQALTLPREETDTGRAISSLSTDSARPVSVPSPRGRLGWGNHTAKQTPSPRTLLTLGILLGLGLLTKIYVYALLPLCLLMILLITWRTAQANRKRAAIGNIASVLAPALLIGLPMWIRNMRLYGILDPLGLAWHDRVVAGQPTLADWITQFGWPAYWERAFSFTFRSFWGVFGWLSVFLDERIYTLFAFIVGIAIFGLLWAIVRIYHEHSRISIAQSLSAFQWWALLFLAGMLLAVLVSYILYNTKFVQHQGRYLFWGLLPIGLLFAGGWREAQRIGSRIGTAIFIVLLTVWLGLGSQLTLASPMDFGEINKWTVLTGGLLAALFLSRVLLQKISKRDKLRAPPAHMMIDRGRQILAVFINLFPYTLSFAVSIIAIFGLTPTKLSSF